MCDDETNEPCPDTEPLPARSPADDESPWPDWVRIQLEWAPVMGEA